MSGLLQAVSPPKGRTVPHDCQRCATRYPLRATRYASLRSAYHSCCINYILSSRSVTLTQQRYEPLQCMMLRGKCCQSPYDNFYRPYYVLGQKNAG